MRIVVNKILKAILVIGGVQVVLIFLMGIYSITTLALIWAPLFVLPFALLYCFLRENKESRERGVLSKKTVIGRKQAWLIVFIVYIGLYFPLRQAHVYVHRSSIEFCGPKLKCTKHKVHLNSMWDTTGFHEILTSPFIISIAYFPLKRLEESYWQIKERENA